MTFYYIHDMVADEIRRYDNFDHPRPPVLYPSIESARKWLVQERRRVNNLRKQYAKSDYVPSWLPRPFNIKEWQIVEIRMLEVGYTPAS